MTNHPEICGFYSITEDGEYEDSASSLRYFIKPRLPIDLNKGIDYLKEKPYTYDTKKIYRILKFIVNHKREFLNKNASPQNGESLIPSTQYIFSPGIIRAIICSKVAQFPWSIIATKYKGNIYLCQYQPEEDNCREHSWNETGHHGSMFEHNCLSGHPQKNPDTSRVCNGNTKFFCVFKTGLVNRQLLYANEMEGTESETPLDPEEYKEWNLNKFVKLKVNYELTSRNRRYKFENVKVHFMCAHCYLTGCGGIYIGFRDNNGIVNQIKYYSANKLEKMSKKTWNDSMDRFEYLNFFLNKVEADLKDVDCPYTTITYSYDPNSKELSASMNKGQTEYSFLPEWYLQEMRTNSL